MPTFFIFLKHIIHMKFFLMSGLNLYWLYLYLLPMITSVGPEIIFTSNGIYYFTNKINLFNVFIYFIPLDTEIYLSKLDMTVQLSRSSSNKNKKEIQYSFTYNIMKQQLIKNTYFLFHLNWGNMKKEAIYYCAWNIISPEKLILPLFLLRQGGLAYIYGT